MSSHSDGPMRTHQTALNAGRFLLQRSKSTGRHCFPPRVASLGDGTCDLEWVEASGDGTVYAVTVVSRRPDKGGNYNIAIVELDEGPRMMSRIVGIESEAVRIGMPVRARIATPDFGPLGQSGQAAVLFEPATDGGGRHV